MSTRTILFADDDAALAQALALRCRAIGLNATISPDGLHAYGAILKSPPDLLVLDINMPAANGLNMCEELARDRRFAPIPVIILTGSATPDVEERCRRLGAHYVLKGAGAWEKLEPLVIRLLDLEPGSAASTASSRAPSAPRVLSVDDEPDVSLALQVRLRAYGIEVLRAFSGMQGYWTALKEQPDVILMDYQMPDGRGDYLLGRLKNHSLTRDIPIIVLTGRHCSGRKDCALERELIGLGASAYLCKPLDIDALLKELRNHIRVGRPPSPIPAAAIA